MILYNAPQNMSSFQWQRVMIGSTRSLAESMKEEVQLNVTTTPPATDRPSMNTDVGIMNVEDALMRRDARDTDVKGQDRGLVRLHHAADTGAIAALEDNPEDPPRHPPLTSHLQRKTADIEDRKKLNKATLSRARSSDRGRMAGNLILTHWSHSV